MKREETMERSVPIWVLHLCFLVWLLLAMTFGWLVQSTMDGNSDSGTIGEIAITVASFPTTAKEVLEQVSEYASGDYKDEAIRVLRDETADYTGFRPIPTAPEIDLRGLLMKADPGRMAYGWRLLAGAFMIDGEIEQAALLISPDLAVVKVWRLDEIPVHGLMPKPKHRKFVHGLEILDDASLIFIFDAGISLQRFDRCGSRQWAVGGKFHHAVTLDDTGDSVWTLESKDADTILQVSVDDGAVIRRIVMDDVISKNPMIDIFELRRLHPNKHGTNQRNTKGRWMKSRFHLNDVDPLPAALADRFDEFDAGDLLISSRSLNLVFVMDPDTLAVKWWRIGAFQRQHDPDWLPNGEIMVLNNRMSRDFSEIVSIDPETFRRTTLFDGKRNDFYTRIRGKHQMLDSGAILVTSSQQGRAFEVDRNGDVVFELVNVKPGSQTANYVISELRWLDPDSFDLGSNECN